MGKVLHASASGYFTSCLEEVGAIPDLAVFSAPVGMSLIDAMAVFWRVRSWEASITGTQFETAPAGTFRYRYPSVDNYQTFWTNPYSLEEARVCEVPGLPGSQFNALGVITIPVIVTFPSEENPDPPYPLTIPGNFGLGIIFADLRVKKNNEEYFVNLESDGNWTTGFFGSYDLGVQQVQIFENTYSVPLKNFSQFPSGSVNIKMRPKEWWSFGGTYDTTTGLPL
jgi:hypothetical protein